MYSGCVLDIGQGDSSLEGKRNKLNIKLEDTGFLSNSVS